MKLLLILMAFILAIGIYGLSVNSGPSYPSQSSAADNSAAHIGETVMVRPGMWVCASTKQAFDEITKWAVRGDNAETLRTIRRTNSFTFAPDGFQVKIIDSGFGMRKVRVTGWLDPDDKKIHAYPEEKRIGRECWVASEAVSQ